MDSEKTKRIICDEIEKITDKGINTGNIEHLYKLIDMYKDMVTVEAMEEGTYSEDYTGNSMARGRGRNARRDSMGRYSRNSYNSYEGGMSNMDYAEARYSQAKQDYRNSRAGKSDVMDTLDETMREIKGKLQQMSRESDFPEEREKIDKYVNMLDRLV